MNWTKQYKRIRFGGTRYRCNICGQGARYFFPFSKGLQQLARENNFPYSFQRMETLNYENCNCPFCLSSDRERLYLIFLEKFFNESDKQHYHILDFAPNAAFSTALRGKPFVTYTSADLFRDDIDKKLDVCDMPEISDKSYDIVICSHVLEHVPDTTRAVSEIRRVLADDGIAIIMVPLFLDVNEKAEDKQHVTPQDRTKHYGQDDHVRLYSRAAFLKELNDGGFNVEMMRPDRFDSEQIRINAISDNSILYINTKK